VYKVKKLRPNGGKIKKTIVQVYVCTFSQTSNVPQNILHKLTEPSMEPPCHTPTWLSENSVNILNFLCLFRWLINYLNWSSNHLNIHLILKHKNYYTFFDKPLHSFNMSCTTITLKFKMCLFWTNWASYWVEKLLTDINLPPLTWWG